MTARSVSKAIVQDQTQLLSHVCQVLVWEEAMFIAMPQLSIPEIWMHLGRVHIGQDSFQSWKKNQTKTPTVTFLGSGGVSQSSFTIFKDSTLIHRSH